MALHTPILHEVATPSNIMWVPTRLFIVNLCLMGGVGVFANIIDFPVVLPGAILFSIASHGYMAWKFLQDQHFEGAWRAKFSPRRWGANRSKTLTPYPGNKMVA